MPTSAEKRAEAKAAALEKQRIMKELFVQRKQAAAAKAAAAKVAKAAAAKAAKDAKAAKKICPNTGLPCPTPTPTPEPTPTPTPEPTPTPTPEPTLPLGYYLDDVLDKIMPIDPTNDGWIIDENGRLQFAPLPVDYKDGDPPPQTWIKTTEGGITHGPLPAGWHYTEGGIERIIPQGWGIGENGELLGG